MGAAAASAQDPERESAVVEHDRRPTRRVVLPTRLVQRGSGERTP
jgi:hypothetical protein